MHETTPDTLVIGVGCLGLAAAYERVHCQPQASPVYDAAADRSARSKKGVYVG